MSGTREMSASDKPAVSKSDAEWRGQLSREEYAVLRMQHTEARWKGYTNSKDEGVFVCKACENPLYKSSQKFDSGCGWPAFEDCLPGSVLTRTDADGHRIEILCDKCHSHLGHVFKGERFTATNTRHCVNSICLRLRSKDEIARAKAADSASAAPAGSGAGTAAAAAAGGSKTSADAPGKDGAAAAAAAGTGSDGKL